MLHSQMDADDSHEEVILSQPLPRPRNIKDACNRSIEHNEGSEIADKDMHKVREKSNDKAAWDLNQIRELYSKWAKL